ncbi:hypothetical protein Q31b_16930 [Novipirellula aureliae]|uniref:Uncharacterized protein n=1 Tax=Novipirellula aureliae TaxID=2527966 RepID=A0A5C6E853_9BACT|nr:hypothetical protein [Novipirellula aureliae]TWU44157.1 hypothetical protein Q31b_16930 [Novipirellula aureliae]
MLNDFNERLAIAKANLRQKDKLDSMLRSAQHSLAESRRKREQLKDILTKEQADVDALEGLSVTGLFYAMLGSKEQRLEKERQELVAAKLKYDQVAGTVEDLSDDVKRLQEARSNLGDADSRYQRVLAEKAEYLTTNESDVARKLIELTQQIADLTADQKELDEAAVAGQSALRSVNEIQSTLASAANWGTLDMFGGGMLTTMAKHSRMDAAKNQARIAQRKLLRFEEELADADERLQVSLEIDGFSKFADYFFDGLIADWIVQSKINKAKTECSTTISRVKAAIRKCQRRLESVESEIESLTESKRELIETA